MEKLIFYIPENEITDTASFLDAIKARIIEKEKSLGHNIRSQHFLKRTRHGNLYRDC